MPGRKYFCHYKAELCSEFRCNSHIIKCSFRFEQSLTGHGCGKAIHATGEHLARVQFLSVCNCGRSRHFRNDPFSLIHANFGFYERPDCCADLPAITFSSNDDSEADMTCTETPISPKFSSWSCVCLGPSSRYSHKVLSTFSLFRHLRKIIIKTIYKFVEPSRLMGCYCWLRVL